MLADSSGQGYTEYVVLLASVLAIAAIIVATITLSECFSATARSHQRAA